MCGIYGVISTGWTNASLVKYFADATLAGAVRGTDSVGIFQIDKDGQKLYIEKKAVAAGDFLELKQSKAIIGDVDGSPITIGHHRAATQGKITDENAHPFRILLPDDEYVIGVHNGSLTSWNKKDFGEDFEVDSHWALTKIAKEGPDALNKIKGAFVFVWYDSRTPLKLHVARGTGRPFHLATTLVSSAGSVTNSVLMASEGRMLDWLADRNSLHIKDGNIYSLEENTYVTLDAAVGKIGEFTKQKIVPEIVVSTSYSSRGSHTYSNNNWGQATKDKIKELIEKAKAELNGKPMAAKDKPRIKTDSIELAKELKLYKKLCFFEFKSYDANTRTVNGKAIIDDYDREEIKARIHGVDKNVAKALALADFAECEVVAACVENSPSNVVVMLKHPTSIYAGTVERSDKIDALLRGTRFEGKGKLFGEVEKLPAEQTVH